jgi:hypothetical protein
MSFFAWGALADAGWELSDLVVGQGSASAGFDFSAAPGASRIWL